uniref:Protein kinase domain-containing protein n=1 Tax=Caenorhabditis tropicalis TaxID=1561998 RepID=A0A1I7U0Z2_9PELO
MIEKGQNYIRCKRLSKEFLKFHLFVQEKNKFFTTASIVNRNDSTYFLKCLGGYYSENVILRDSEKQIDVPYDPLNGFLMDSKKFSNQTFYQCVHENEKISFLDYPNQNTLKNDVKFKMMIQSFTLNYEMQCIIEGEIPGDIKMKSVLVCPATSECPEDDSDHTLTISLFDLISFGWQIARALQYLKECGITHRDVAMRNVLVTNALYCKLIDFERAEKGESQDGNFGTDLFNFFTVKLRNRSRNYIPSMYPEECKKGAYYYETEVYCFGLLLLEMFSFMKPIEPNKRLNPEQPHYCPRPIYDIILECLKANRQQRMSINDCVVRLSMLAESNDKKKYLDLNEGLTKEGERNFIQELRSPDYLLNNPFS